MSLEWFKNLEWQTVSFDLCRGHLSSNGYWETVRKALFVEGSPLLQVGNGILLPWQSLKVCKLFCFSAATAAQKEAVSTVGVREGNFCTWLHKVLQAESTCLADAWLNVRTKVCTWSKRTRKNLLLLHPGLFFKFFAQQSLSAMTCLSSAATRGKGPCLIDKHSIFRVQRSFFKVWESGSGLISWVPAHFVTRTLTLLDQFIT